MSCFQCFGREATNERGGSIVEASNSVLHIDDPAFLDGQENRVEELRVEGQVAEDHESLHADPFQDEAGKVADPIRPLQLAL